MAFTLTDWSRQSVALNTGEVSVSGTLTGGPAIFSYRSAGDAVATIAAADYFTTVAYDLSLDDLIYVVGSDAVGMYVVSTLDRSDGSVELTAASLTGTVETANIAALAVTTAKIANDAVTSAKINEDVIQYAVVSITAAQFNGMYVTPKLLVAAAGADTMLVLESCQLLMTYVSADYAAGGVAHIQYDSTTLGAGIIASTTQAAADFQDSVSTANGFNQGIVKQPFSTCVNKGLYLSNVTGAFTTGDSTFEAHIWYREVPSV